MSARGGRHGEAGGKGVRWGLSGRNGGIEAIHPQERKTSGGAWCRHGAGGKGEAPREGKGGARASGEMAAMGVFGRSSAVGSRPRESLRATSSGGRPPTHGEKNEGRENNGQSGG